MPSPGIQSFVRGFDRVMWGSSDCTGKRKRVENNNIENRLYGFQTFGDPGCPADFDGPFRDNIRIFLQDFARLENFLVDGMTVWSIALRVDDSSCISMFVMEEMVQNALRPHCDYCQFIGWNHHLMSKCRYHFIIPAQKSNDKNITEVVTVLDMPSHLLHGMFHSNGFGHLVCINGREKGSKNASGREIMDLWDRTCAMLRARKVSVEDVGKKKAMELRLLHCVAYGDTWFGRWGFKFAQGSQQTYLKAIEAIRGMPLSVMLQHFRGQVDHDVASVVAVYQKLSGNSVQTVGKLMSFMMEFKSRLPREKIKAT
ncbi:hypothetical protein KI387_031449 [Taxus chinensis]|uniref:Uncharacterized protein n=1 Tax=Taxus chinensis TaxID=29808 RepID=A0AA38CL81_TAXCH|nr:hypothetical protein KI387_031449 [Taxus chinensis]